jgi:chemotaxis protein histidine kinase CheA
LDLVAQVTAVLDPQWDPRSPGFLSNDFKRHIHTHKGEARSLGLWELSRFLHLLEDGFSHSDAQGLDEVWAVLHTTWQELADDYGKLLNDLMEGQAAQENQYRRSLLGLVGLKSHLLTEHLGQHGFTNFTLTVQDSINVWPRSISDVLEKVLIHSLINAADHGYILPAQTMPAHGEPVFRIEASLVSDLVQIKIMDQGAGVNLAKIRTLAERHHIPLENDQSILEVLFLDGVTTNDQVTPTSGRGVGLPAIRSLVVAVHGNVRLQTNQDKPGMTLILEFPSSHLFTAAEAA